MDTVTIRPREWVLQVHAVELGNTVQMTPAIQAIARKWGRPVPMYFQTTWLRDLWRDAPFIEHLYQQPDVPFLFESADRSPGDCLTAEWYWRTFCLPMGITGERPQPYTDRPAASEAPQLPDGPKIAIVQGCCNKPLYARKNNGGDFRLELLWRTVEAGATPVIIGSEQDWKWSWHHMAGQFPREVVKVVGQPIRSAVAAGLACDGLMCNDTGLLHVLTGCHKMQTLCVARRITPEWHYRYPTARYEIDPEPMRVVESITEWLASLGLRGGGNAKRVQKLPTNAQRHNALRLCQACRRFRKIGLRYHCQESRADVAADEFPFSFCPEKRWTIENGYRYTEA